jgi:hypothetical protein
MVLDDHPIRALRSAGALHVSGDTARLVCNAPSVAT